MPFFSVIVPLYNKQEYIADTLSSVIAQTFTDFELIIVNDGSNDDSEAVVKNFTDCRVRYIKKENGGASSARNIAIKMAAGKLIAFLDADDILLPNHLQVLHNLYTNHPDAGLFASRYYFKVPGNKLQKTNLNNLDENFEGIVPDFFISSLNHRIATSSSVAVLKSAFNTAGYFNEGYTNGEDTDMWIRIGIQYPVAISNQYTAIYNFHIADTMSKKALSQKKIMNFNQYKEHEVTNNGLKQFLDLYRLEYALKYRIAGNTKLSNSLYRDASPKNTSMQQKVLLNLPPLLLKTLLFIKKGFYNMGFVKV